jgi:hypothetical protein
MLEGFAGGPLASPRRLPTAPITLAVKITAKPLMNLRRDKFSEYSLAKESKGL